LDRKNKEKNDLYLIKNGANLYLNRGALQVKKFTKTKSSHILQGIDSTTATTDRKELFTRIIKKNETIFLEITEGSIRTRFSTTSLFPIGFSPNRWLTCASEVTLQELLRKNNYDSNCLAVILNAISRNTENPEKILKLCQRNFSKSADVENSLPQ
jgi:hypothetical protein